MSDKNIKNSKQLFSLALILGIWSPFIQASDIKIDEKAFQEMIEKKKKEGALLESKHIAQKPSILSPDLIKRLKDIPIISEKSINVVVTLKTNDIDLKPVSSSAEVIVNKDGEQKVLIDGKEEDIEVLEQENEKILAYQKKATKLRNEELQKSLQKFSKTYSFLGKRVLKDVLSSDKDYFEIRLSKSEIMKLAQNKDLIMGIELTQTPYDEIDDAMISTKVDPYAFYGNEGGKVNIYMSDGGCEADGYTTNYERLSGSSEWHGKHVLNILRAVSPESFIYCRDGYRLPYDSWYWSDPDVEIQNHSWGLGSSTTYRTEDRDFDNFIIEHNDVIFKSAGNRGNTLTPNVTSPGKGLNVITVGNYDDDTNGIYFQSSYGDPQTKNQKPEIVAPGTEIDTDLDGTPDGSGTSWSAPHAAAFAADLMSNYTWMKHKPHLMKTVMLAGATKNITGSEDEVGVGGIDFGSANYEFQYTWWTNKDYDYEKAHDSGTNNEVLEWKTNNLSAGRRYRAVISWLNRGDYTYNHRTDMHPIGKDFDMSVFDPNGNRVCGSDSWDNPYEVCNFKASVSGQYMIRIHRAENRDKEYSMSLAVGVNRY